MNKRRWAWVCCGLFTIGLVVASYRQLNPPPRPGSIAYHVGELGRLRSLKGYVFEGRPQGRFDWLHPKTWRWWALGSHDFKITRQEMDRHMAVLLRMGHYQRREIVLSNNIMNEPWDQGILTNLFVGNEFFHFELDAVRPNLFGVTSTREDADGIERILRRWDAEKTIELGSESVPAAE